MRNSEKNRYFKNTCVLATRPAKFKNLNEAKHEAYKAAVNGVKNGFTDKWADEYVNNITFSSTFMWYEDMIRIYADFLLHKVAKQDARKKMQIIERRWAHLDDMCKEISRNPSAFVIMA